MKERRNVRAIVFDDSNGQVEFLLLYARKGYWQFPQGGVDTGETEVEAVQREVLEETGLRVWKRDVIISSKIDALYFAQREGNPIKVFLSAYAVRANSTKEIVIGRGGDAHSDFQWVSYARALKLLIEYPEQKKVFEKVVKLMKFEL